MATLANMRTRIADDLNRSDLTSQINEAINRAIDFYEKEQFWFQDATGTFATVDGQKVYTTSDSLPSDIATIDYMEITSGTTDYTLTEKPVKWIEISNPQDTEGLPTNFGWWDYSVYFYLVPDAAYTVTVYYQKSYADLSADGDSNDFTTYAEDLIEARARWWLNTRVLYDFPAADRAKAEEAEALMALRQKHSNYKDMKICPSRF